MSCIAKLIGVSRGLHYREDKQILLVWVDFEVVQPTQHTIARLSEQEEKELRIPYLRGCVERMRTPSEEGFQTWIVEGFSPLTEGEITLLKGEVELCDSMLRRRIPESEKKEWAERRCSALTQLGGDPQKGGVQ